MESLCGLSPTDLTNEQLAKVHSTALIRMQDQDNRIMPILLDRLANLDVKELAGARMYGENKFSFIRSLNKSNLDDKGIKQYRDFYIRVFHTYRSNTYIRRLVAKLDLFDDHIMSLETEAYIHSDSVLYSNSVDYTTIKNISPEYFNRSKERILEYCNNDSRYRYMPPGFETFISTAPEEDIKDIGALLATKKHKNAEKARLITAKKCPQEYVDMALRSLSKTTSGSYSIKRSSISIKDLSKLPPVMRLNAMEKMHNVLAQFAEEEIGLLLFPLISKHYNRVSNLTRIVNELRNRQKDVRR